MFVSCLIKSKHCCGMNPEIERKVGIAGQVGQSLMFCWHAQMDTIAPNLDVM